MRLGGMDRKLGRRQAEDQPTSARIGGIEAEHLTEESAIGVGIAAVENDVCAEDHTCIMPAASGRCPLDPGYGTRRREIDAPMSCQGARAVLADQ